MDTCNNLEYIYVWILKYFYLQAPKPFFFHRNIRKKPCYWLIDWPICVFETVLLVIQAGLELMAILLNARIIVMCHHARPKPQTMKHRFSKTITGGLGDRDMLLLHTGEEQRGVVRSPTLQHLTPLFSLPLPSNAPEIPSPTHLVTATEHITPWHYSGCFFLYLVFFYLAEFKRGRGNI